MANINLVALAFRLDGKGWNMKILIPSGKRCEFTSHLPCYKGPRVLEVKAQIPNS